MFFNFMMFHVRTRQPQKDQIACSMKCKSRETIWKLKPDQSLPEKFHVKEKERSVLHLEWLNPDRTFRDISVPDPTPKQDQGKNE